MSGPMYRKPMVKKGQPSRPTRRQQLKQLDAIGFDELADFLSEGVHTAFRKGTDCHEADVVWRAMRAMPRAEWSKVFDWVIFGLRVTTGREKKQ